MLREKFPFKRKMPPIFEIRQSTIYYAGLLGRWYKRIVDQESDVQSVTFSYTFYRLRVLKTHYFYFCNFIYIKKINKLIGFLQRILEEIMKKNNTWNIRHLIHDSVVPLSKRTSVLYCKLTEFWIMKKTFLLLLNSIPKISHDLL